MRMSKLMLPAVTVAGALALAGCGGGGGGTTPTVDNCATEALPFEGGDGNCYASETAYDTLVANRKAADEAIKAADDAAEGLDATSTSEDVGAVEKLIEAAETAINALPESEREDKMAELDTADGNVDIIKTVLGLTEDVNTQTELANENAATANRNQLIIDESRKALRALAEAEDFLDNAEIAAVRLTSTSRGVNGSSQQVYNNVMAALNARASINAELDKANAAVTALEGIETDGLSDGAKQVVTNAITEARSLAAGISAILTPGDNRPDPLKSAENNARGLEDPKAEPSKIARSRAKAVADAMKLQIDRLPLSNTDLAVRTRAPATVIKEHFVPVGDSGRTFRQITGGVALSVTTLARVDYRFIDSSGDPQAYASLTSAIGSQIAAGVSVRAEYKGIPGRLHCAVGEACAYADGEFTAGNVLFFPDDREALYQASASNTRYEPVVNAASYGYWLNSDGEIVRHVSSLTDDDHELLWTADNNPVAGKDPVEATYSGKAGGYSQRQTGKGSDKVRHSGEFTADVHLRATFGGNHDAQGDTTFIDGTINGFAAAEPAKGTDHVNPNWAVDLTKMGINSANGAEAGTPTAGGTEIPNRIQVLASPDYRAGEVGATSGRWSAHAYGEPEAALADRTHPTGFVGAFDARFGLEGAEGSAKGVYHAEAD